jgi:amino acid adenylation domain-containing protein
MSSSADTSESTTRSETLDRLVAMRAAMQPSAAAASDEVATLSYGELDAEVDRIARALVTAGVTRETIVAVSLRRGVRLPVALLAIARAGGTYLPVDPAYPAERIAYMLDDSGADFLLSDDPVGLGERPATTAQPLTWDALDGLDGAPVLPMIDADDRAYLIYTSGSTGRPKGVEVTHGALTNFLLATMAEPGITADDVQLAVASISFDLSILELALPVAAGAHVVIAAAEATTNGEMLAELLERYGVTYLHATPATWRLLVSAGSNGTRTAVSGGEALAADLARELLSRSGSVWNSYGPTETTIGSTLAHVQDAERISIGHPIANTVTYVVDASGEEVGAGVEGELWIGGAGVARGYLGRPELTAERFLDNPFGPGRVYRTGDRVALADDGAIEYRGRLDDQIKLRGFRIEPGEIEAALRGLEGIQDAVVVVHEQAGGGRLVGFLTTQSSAPVDTPTIRAALERSLPDYMIPAAFTVLDHLPLTGSGKVDRAALSSQVDVAPRGGTAAAAARTPTEATLVAIWEGLLGVEPISIDDNFFELGGHSLLAAEVAAQAREALGTPVPLRLLFASPTIAGLAEALKSLSPDDPSLQAIPRAQRRPVTGTA